MRSLRSVSDVYPRARAAGLTPDQAADSAARFGLNRLTPLPREPVWVKFLAKFDEPIIKILLAASLLKIVVDLFAAGVWAGLAGLTAVAGLFAAAGLFTRLRVWLPALAFVLAGGLAALSGAVGNPSVEGLAVMVAVALATGVSFLSEYRSDREFEALNTRKDAIRATVLRGGEVGELPLDDLVVGDLVVLGAGDEVPADGRVVRADDLLVDQSLMTGESEPAAKDAAADADEAAAPDRPGCVYRGTQVVGGAGRMLVTNVGDDTMLGQIARRLSGDSPADADAAAGRVHRKLAVAREQTPLQEKLEALAGLISRVGYAAAVAIFVALFVRGLAVGELRWPAADEPAGRVLLADFRAVLGYFVYMVIVIVVAVPEGLPMSVTVSLALAMRKMTRANALVRQLVATETIGSATVICTDKTGTLTENRMSVARVFLGGRGYAGPLDPDVPVGPGSGHDLLAVNAAVNSTAHLTEAGGKPQVVGNTTEGALLLWLAGGAWRPDAAGPAPDYRAYRERYAVVHQVHFSSDRKRMTTVVEAGGRQLVLVKGAPEAVLLRCSAYAEQDGAVSQLGATERSAVELELSAAARGAMRTLGFAYRELPAGTPKDEIAALARADDLECGLMFVGFVAIRDPLRADVGQAVRQCHAAGIEVKMITGDNPETARAIARECGLLDRPDAAVLTSGEFEKLSDDELKDRLPRLRVLARANPLDKYRLVRLLQEQGHVVAMTGDGTNDAPSLRKADVGLAMGRTGTEVAKEASKIVLLDDAFGTIVKAVHWGRALYENIQKFIQFQLTINVSALAIAFLGPFLGLRPPFTVLQLLWINVIMDTFAAIALCSEPPRAGLLRLPPKRRDESILTRGMVTTILSTAAFFVVVMLGLLLGMRDYGWFAHAAGGPPSDPSAEFAGFTDRQVTIFFTAYVFFQVWNQINCRSLSPDVSGFRGLFRNGPFLLVTLATVAGQVLIVTVGGDVFHVEPLGWLDWLAIAGATASVLVYAEVVRRLRRSSSPLPRSGGEGLGVRG